MRKFNNYEAVKINSEEEGTEFLKYLADNTDLEWHTGGKITGLEMEKSSRAEYPIFFEAYEGGLCIVRLEGQLDVKTKIIPLSEFIKPKVTYTREQAEAVFFDSSLFHNGIKMLSRQDNAFLDHKFPKPILEQVTEAVKDLGNFKIEQTITGTIMISPINN